MTIDADIQAARAAEPGDLDAIRALVLMLDELAETQRVTRNLQAEAALALGTHLQAHPRAERAGLVPGFVLTLDRAGTKRYDSAMVRSRVTATLADDPTLTADIDRESGEIEPIPPSETVRRTCAAVWPLVGAHTDGFAAWRSQALKRYGISLSRYLLTDDEDDGPVKGRVIRIDGGQDGSPESEQGGTP